MHLQPIVKNSRIQAVDAVRGFALFGVLLANVPTPTMEGLSTGWDESINFIYHFLIDNKFIAIFSMLFGFGFSIQLQRAAEKKVKFTRYFVIRMLLLFLIGSLHAFLIWNGDIIRSYALGGILLLFVRRWSIKQLLITALFFNVLATGIIFIGNSALGWQIYDYDYALDREYLITPSFWRYLTINAIMDPWVNFLKDMPITLAFTFGNMLIGLILGKIDFFRYKEKTRSLNKKLIIGGGTFGLGSSYLYYLVVSGALELSLPLLWLPFVVLAGMILQSLMYIALFVSLFQRPAFRRFLNGFSPVGRTALSNYLLQSVFYLVVFFHCTQGFQLFGKITTPETYGLALAFFGLQSLFSYLWLRRYAQGPVEYLWKRLSYAATRLQKKETLSTKPSLVGQHDE